MGLMVSVKFQVSSVPGVQDLFTYLGGIMQRVLERLTAREAGYVRMNLQPDGIYRWDPSAFERPVPRMGCNVSLYLLELYDGLIIQGVPPGQVDQSQEHDPGDIALLIEVS